MIGYILLLLIVLAAFSYFFGRKRAVRSKAANIFSIPGPTITAHSSPPGSASHPFFWFSSGSCFREP